MYKLSPDEEAALGQIDLLKEEVVNAVRVKRESGKDQFKISPRRVRIRAVHCTTTASILWL